MVVCGIVKSINKRMCEMSITIQEVKKLAKLSRLEFSDDEANQFLGEFDAILEQVDAINKVDVSKVDLLEDTIDADTQLRADVIKPSLPAAEIIANAPASEDTAFLVPVTVVEE